MPHSYASCGLPRTAPSETASLIGYIQPGEKAPLSISFPNESQNYRAARDALLQRELHLRREMESVAAELRALPPGGEVPEDYLFDCIGEDGTGATVPMSELFRGGDTLMLYLHVPARRAG